MSQVLSNLGLSLPSSSKSCCNSLLNLKSSCSLSSPVKPSSSFSIKAMALDGRGNLDHLQRINNNNKQQQQAPQPRRKIVPSAPVGMWDRFPTARTVQQMMDTMERLVEDPLLLAYSPQLSMEDPRGGYSRGRTPWEIKEGENEYKMRFDMPGMTKSDVRLWVEDKMLVVKAEKSAANKDGEVVEGADSSDWSAKSYGKYSSRIALPENVEFEKIKAEVKDGVLYISIPKASPASKILDINVE
ncbi:unnamed protein product [Linum trigynum]|uniref:SHSP domain-containing protein n=1 Tax=Linum trigynum TaxID=586398 RepID=A0AAV2GRW4_9ROSI